MRNTWRAPASRSKAGRRRREKNKSGTASAAGYFKTTRHAVDATPELLDGSPVH